MADGTLPAARVAQAAARVASLARPVRRPSETPTLPDAARIAGAFDVRPGAVVPAGARAIQLQTVANMAIGTVPWGLADAGVAVETLVVGEPLPTDPLVLIGKDNHRHALSCKMIDDARAAGPTLVVDMGWPSPDRPYADVATFGASRAVGAALAGWLAEQDLELGADTHGRGAAR